MEWTRKTKEFEYADYVSEDGRFRVRDMSMHDRTGWWKENGKRGLWWGLIEVKDGVESIVAGNFKTAKNGEKVRGNHMKEQLRRGESPGGKDKDVLQIKSKNDKRNAAEENTPVHQGRQQRKRDRRNHENVKRIRIHN